MLDAWIIGEILERERERERRPTQIQIEIEEIEPGVEESTGSSDTNFDVSFEITM